MSTADEALLDNAVYEALCGPHAHFAQVRGHARRYPVEVAPFLGLRSSATEQDWADAAYLVEPDGYAAVVSGCAEPPDTWQVVGRFDLVQMVGERVAGASCPQAIRLRGSDVPEMLELVALTEPGPFLARTIELGDYLGIRSGDGTLLAMAGERLRVAGWTEISGVCTRPGNRGQGLASRLVRALIQAIQMRSERVFLHVLATNVSAVRLYEQLGFRVRRTATLRVLTPAPLRSSQP